MTAKQFLWAIYNDKDKKRDFLWQELKHPMELMGMMRSLLGGNNPFELVTEEYINNYIKENGTIRLVDILMREIHEEGYLWGKCSCLKFLMEAQHVTEAEAMEIIGLTNLEKAKYKEQLAEHEFIYGAGGKK